MFEYLGIPLQKRVGLHVTNEIGSSTLIGCGLKVTKGGTIASEQGPQTPFGPIPGVTSTFSGHTLDTLLQDQIHLKEEIIEVKKTLIEEKALNTKCHGDLLSAISSLTAKFTSPPP